MKENNKTEAPDLKKKHFAKFHEKIQNKYDEMQKKLAKSKSVDTLTTLRDDFYYQEVNYNSNQDFTESDDTKSDNQSITPLVISEESTIEHASYQEIRREANVLELVEDFMIIEKEDKNRFFGKNFSRLSVESLNEATLDSDGTITPSTSQPKLSIRSRISSRFSAAKEKRKESKKEKENNLKVKDLTSGLVDSFILSNTTKQDVLKIYKRTKVATVTIALIEASGFESDISEDKPRMLFCRFRLGGDKYKSKLIKAKGAEVKWQELFNLPMYDDEHILEIGLWDKESCIGRSAVDLSRMEKERTHKLRSNLVCSVGKAEVFMLLTITGSSLDNNLEDRDDEEALRRLALASHQVKEDTGEVGRLSVIVYGAKGLITNECYCILELGNERVQTQTKSKTNDPNWMKLFTFVVNDITSILEVTIHDERKSEDIGKVSIPLLDITNGEKKWYALKDVTQRERARGNNPRILLEINVTWDTLRASLRVINPKEVIYLETEDKLQRHTFARNLSRARAVLNWILESWQIVKTLFEWESRKINIITLTLWLLFCWFFKIWMIPLLFLVPFMYYKPEHFGLINWKRYLNKKLAVEVYEESKKDKEEKNTSLMQKINSLTDMVQTVQNFIGTFASYGESIKNLFNFTVPFLSILAIVMVSAVTFVMYLIPLKYILMIWAVHKFTRKILRPNRIPNNEIIDLLSRVPDDETLLNIRELPLEDRPEDDVIK